MLRWFEVSLVLVVIIGYSLETILKLLQGRRFKWIESCQDAFDCLKSKLTTSAPGSAFPDYNRQFILHCDASNVAIGGILNQVFESGERPIGYFSRKLRGTEVNYSITEQEDLAIFESVKFF